MNRVPLWIQWFTLLVFCNSTLQGQLTANSGQRDVLCDCGYHDPSTNDQAVWANAWIIDFGNSMNDVSLSTPTSMSHLKKDFFMANYEIPAKYKDSYSRHFSANNVKIQNEALHLVVTVDNTTLSPEMQQKHSATRCGAIGTKRQDILYGSFRSLMRLTSSSGTVQSMYFFHPGGEIDIEILGAVTPPQSYFAIHPGLQEPNGRASALTHDNHHLGFDPSSGFHEYRFDWYPDRAEFYIDGHLAQTLTTNIPQTPGRFMFSHWSDGNPKFSHGPPANDASMEIKSIVALSIHLLDRIK
ncbi:concanavalin A-like lectin/glucanase domain-containing protein [Absidia repens]|uniref:Concanavalin A-like lectin/glucanase domain-containing protein n=1 Tax=Absidia repens TaxID=90262 RepID=A0A1X2ISL3_9FUNG|nr:concanavalin A-like lectin/glucanase domain-containing protein [Absidia repens]